MAELSAAAERFNTAAPDDTSEGETRAAPRVQIVTAANTVHHTSARENAQGTRSNSSFPQVVRVAAAPPQLKGTIPTQGEPYRFQGHERADGSKSYSRINDQVEEARLRKCGWNVVRLFRMLEEVVPWLEAGAKFKPGVAQKTGRSDAGGGDGGSSDSYSSSSNKGHKKEDRKKSDQKKKQSRKGRSSRERKPKSKHRSHRRRSPLLELL